MAKTLDEAGVKRLIQEIKGANKNLNTPIPISTENTPESMAQNVKNIADYVEKAKAAGIANVNGMAVTCIIDDDYSGVGYLYGDTTICGIKTNDALEAPSFFDVESGSYHENEVLVKGLSDQIPSDMLVEGARKPIILTPSTTEVDEETYQKLLSDDVDVVFKDDDWYIPITIKSTVDPDIIFLDFSLISFDGSAPYTFDTWMKDIQINIAGNSPHGVTFSYNETSDLDAILQISGYLNKSTLSPVLQEIDLTGTDADRKAKLDQFETDWKALTGAGDLSGARFVGHYLNNNAVMISGVFSYDGAAANYSALTPDENDKPYVISLELDGSITITPLFSHLEAITIKNGNTPADKAANLAAIKAYVDNLTALGVDVTKGYMIPVTVNGRNGFLSTRKGNYPYAGYVASDSTVNDFYNILILGNGEYYDSKIQPGGSGDLTTESKQIVGAINEINANAVHSDKLVPALEAITIKIGSTPENKAANKAAIEAYRDNLTALGVDTTKGFMIPVKTGNGNGFILFDGTKGEGYVKIINDCYGITIRADYDCAAINLMSTSTSYGSLETTSKRVLPAINEVNALAKGYSTIFTPIELTTETAQNKTAIDARMAAFTAQGISLTNGCCIPVTYKGVYAGNISLINGDWYGLLVKNTNNPADNINIKLSADGTITEGNSAQ